MKPSALDFFAPASASRLPPGRWLRGGWYLNTDGTLVAQATPNLVATSQTPPD